ncbi:MAG TPA: non-homologous end-joining DNA ligase [Nevskiaceae bacterium]|nr:non-homologous end-joining DNA ligase [Nevskiaceae bacterium]
MPRSGADAAPRGAFPASVDLALARLVDAAPTGDDWIHEVKYDGFRIVMFRRGDRVWLQSRNGLDWTAKLPHVVEAMRALPCESCVLDGEIVAIDDAGRSRFGLLQQWMGDPRASRKLIVFAFDLLHLDGRDIAALPLLDRKDALHALLKKPRGAIRRSSYVTGHGDDAYARACREGLEGIIAKDVSAPYRGGRTGDWLKVKCVESDEFVIIGYTPGKGARSRMGSVLLAKPTRDGKRYRYAGRVGSGFTEALVDELLERVKHRASAVPLVETPSRSDLRGAHPTWVEPRIIVEVAHRGITEDGRVRQGAVKGMRPDKQLGDLQRSDREIDRRTRA